MAGFGWKLSSEPLPETTVRIAILEKAASFNLNADGSYAVEIGGGEEKVFSNENIYLVKAGTEGILIGDRWFAPPVRVVPKEEGKALRVNGRRYRDAIVIRKNAANQITVVNELKLDEYIYGILPREVSPDWPIESLKAQAVVSRTFALKNLGRHRSEGFNLCSKVHCQVYGGFESEYETTNRAVDETRDEVVTFEGALANTVFFSNCGGRTEEPRNAWESSAFPPYLKSVRCRFCKEGGHFSWSRKLSPEEIVQAVRKKGYGIKPPVRSVKISSTGRSGRAKFLKLQNAGSTVVIRASHFRISLGPDLVKSTLITDIRKVKGGYLLKGKGWGHGVGLCQEGALGMAKQKHADYKKIILFYYPKTKVSKWSSEASSI